MTRYVALDIHKDYFTVVGVDANQTIVLEAKRIFNKRLREWAEKKLLPTDHIVLEMTTNAYLFHDILCPLVASVTVVHPPNVPAVTNAPVKTDLKAAHTLAILLAANVLTGVWIPPQDVRDQRQLVAQRIKMTATYGCLGHFAPQKSTLRTRPAVLRQQRSCRKTCQRSQRDRQARSRQARQP